MTTPCSGLWELFDSTYILDHQAAKALCKTCPVLDACGQRAHELNRSQRADPQSMGMRGTWAGRLYGKAKLSTAPVESRLSISRTDAHNGGVSPVDKHPRKRQ